jgi:hypothetical protein
MVMSVAVLAVSAALFLFYIQALCQKILRQEFSHPYFREIIEAVHLEYPQLRDAYASNGSGDYTSARLTLKCDFFALKYLLKNGDPERRHLLRREKVLTLYFRLMFFSLPLRHALNFHEKEGILELARTLQFFANSVGEKLSMDPIAAAQSQAN